MMRKREMFRDVNEEKWILYINVNKKWPKHNFDKSHHDSSHQKNAFIFQNTLRYSELTIETDYQSCEVVTQKSTRWETIHEGKKCGRPRRF